MKQASKILLTLNGKKLSDLDDFYRVLGKKIKLPKHFGRNLDALWDFLSTDQKEPLAIIWKHSEQSRFSMDKQQFNKLIELFDALKQERDDFHYILE